MTGTEVVTQIVVPALLSALVLVLTALLRAYREEQKRHVTTLEHVEQRHEKALEKLESKQAQMAETLPVEYVRREEFIRLGVMMDRKLDQVLEMLSSLPCKGGSSRECPR